VDREVHDSQGFTLRPATVLAAGERVISLSIYGLKQFRNHFANSVHELAS
jgi:hypothetical protein